MSLKLFRSTGYSSILSAGETRVAMHPGWMILLTSVWAGLACNVALWRELSALPDGGAGLGRALVTSAFIASAGAVVLSVLGWRKTLKPAATLILLLAALAASAAWVQPLPADNPAGPRLFSLILPSWTGLLHWQAWAALAGLALLPAMWVSKTRVRRLPGDEQLGVNLTGILAAGAMLALSGFFLFGRLF